MSIHQDSQVVVPLADDAQPLPVEEQPGIISGLAEHAEAAYVAPDWKLVWWRFKKHRLAFVSSLVIILVSTVAMFPDFFSTQDPNATNATKSFIPVEGMHFIDQGSVRPFVYGVEGERSPKTLRMEWKINETQKIPVRFFTKGYPYKLLGLIPTDIHLVGLTSSQDQESIHLLGSDRLGRDQWSRLMHGTRVSLSIGLVAVFLSIFFGILLGVLLTGHAQVHSGYMPRPVGSALPLLAIMLMTFPSFWV